jgi:hypothetical protein
MRRADGIVSIRTDVCGPDAFDGRKGDTNCEFFVEPALEIFGTRNKA